MPYRTPPPPEKKELEKKPLGLFGRVFHKHEWVMKCDFPDSKKEYWSIWTKGNVLNLPIRQWLRDPYEELFEKYCEVKCKTGGEIIKAKGLPISSKVNKNLYNKIFDKFYKEAKKHESNLDITQDIGGDIDYLYEQQQKTKYSLITYYGQKVVK